MYIDDRPVSVFKQAQSWHLPLEQPSSSLKQPPIGSSSELRARPPQHRLPLFTSSSSSSLRGFEPAIPPFQEFIMRTPSVHPDEPLPASPPLKLRRSDSSIIDLYLQRSSSVYSRTSSLRSLGCERSWETEDLVDEHPLLLQPITYNSKTPNLTIKPARAPLPDSRAFAPLVTSSSPTLNGVTSTFASNLQPEIVLTSPAKSPVISVVGRKPPMVSLEEAKQAMNAPGRVPMLPEELQAEVLKKRKSPGHIRLNSVQILAFGQKVPELSTQVISSPKTIQTPDQRSDKTLASLNTFPVGPGCVRNTAPSSADGVHDSPHQLEPPARSEHVMHDFLDPFRNNNAKEFARDYDSLIRQRRQDHSASSAHGSDDTVPQPLFQGQSLPTSVNSGAKTRDSEDSVSLFSQERKAQSTRSNSGASSRGQVKAAHTRLSVDPPDAFATRGSSRCGITPIPPPADHELKKSGPFSINTRSPWTSKARGHRSRDKCRESEFYPHVIHRRERPKKQETLQPLGTSVFAAVVAAQQLKPPQATPETSSVAPDRVPLKGVRYDSSSETSIKSKGRLYQKLAEGIKSRRSPSNATRPPHIEAGSEAPPASRMSPHLLPSPVNTAAVHLGWSDIAKRNFDEASTLNGSSWPHLTYVATPSPPPEEARRSLVRETESPSTSRRASVFRDFLQSWGKHKTQRRREDLKRSISVVRAAEDPVERRPNLSPGSSSGLKWI